MSCLKGFDARDGDETIDEKRIEYLLLVSELK